MLSASETAATESEADWVVRAQAGDADAFTELVIRHQQRIHALAYRLTGSLTEAEDLTQETFVRAWRQLSGFRRDSSLATWLSRIAVNLSLNWRARNTRRPELADLGGELPDRSTPGSDPAHEQVNEAVQRLPPEQRAAVVLTVYEGMNHAEAARVLGCAETTVSWRIWLARRQLKKWLADLAPPMGQPS